MSARWWRGVAAIASVLIATSSCSAGDFEPLLTCSGDDCEQETSAADTMTLEASPDVEELGTWDAPDPEISPDIGLSDTEADETAADTKPLETTAETSAADAMSDVPDAAVDTKLPIDSSADSVVLDTKISTDAGADATFDTGLVPDTADTAVADVLDTAFVPETGGCTLASFGLSEVMVQTTSGAGDTREWLELTNYGACPLDVSGVRVTVFNGPTVSASLLFPSPTMVAAGEAIVIAANESGFRGSVTVTLGRVFNFGLPSGGLFPNLGESRVRLYAAGSSVAYEDIALPVRTWPVGQSYAYPVPSAACPASSRIVGGAPGPAWKDTPITGPKFGDVAGSPLYGTPTKANGGIACP